MPTFDPSIIEGPENPERRGFFKWGLGIAGTVVLGGATYPLWSKFNPWERYMYLHIRTPNYPVDGPNNLQFYIENIAEPGLVYAAYSINAIKEDKPEILIGRAKSQYAPEFPKQVNSNELNLFLILNGNTDLYRKLPNRMNLIDRVKIPKTPVVYEGKSYLVPVPTTFTSLEEAIHNNTRKFEA